MNVTSTQSLTISQLQERVAFHRDQDAYKKLFLNFYSSLLQFAISIIKEKEASEEIVSDVMVKIWEKREALAEIESLRVYLYTATRNTCINYINRNKNRNVSSLDEIEVAVNISYHNPVDILIKNELKKAIIVAVDSLPPKCKMAYKLVREDGLSYKEVARVMDISENTVDRHLNNALHKLVKAVQHHLN